MRSELRMSWGRARLRIEARSLALASALLALLLVLAWLSLSSGTIRLSAGRIWEALAGGSPDSADSRIVLGLRLPRVAAGLAVGLALGASGAAFQSISRNPLGSPDVIGFTTGAATGAVVHIVVFGASGRAASAGAIASGMATALLVYWLARADRRTGSYRLILVGVGVSAFLGALNTLILARGDIDLAVRARVWLSGSLNAVTWEGAGPTIAVVALVLPVLAGLDVLERGDDQASQLSVRPERLRIAAMLAGVVLTASAVAAAGPIAFVALVAPQATARITRASRVQVVLSGLTGAVLLMSADLLSMRAPVQLPLPVGLVTGLLGGVYLLFLLARFEDV